MGRFFICAHANFPRGGAESNYIEYLALALMERENEVYVFSRGRNQEKEYFKYKDCYCHNGIFYNNINGSYSSIWDFGLLYFSEARYIINMLEKYEASAQDQIILYTTNYFYIKKIVKYAEKKNMKVTTCITEWFQPFQYKGGILNPVYWLDELGFQRGIPMSKRVLPISRYLEQHFKKKGCVTLCLPILANPPEKLIEKQSDDFVQFIYSGNAINKDAVDLIIHTFASLSDKELLRVKLHITGMKSSTVDYLKRKCGKDFARILPILVVHPWLEYDELIELYKRIDYLILLRRRNKVTISNFPSKVPEMMGYGIIPIVSKVGDYTEEYLTDGKDCIQVEKYTIEDSLCAIRKALQLSEITKEKMREEAYHTVKSRFHYCVWSNRIQEFLDGE